MALAKIGIPAEQFIAKLNPFLPGVNLSGREIDS
jgi:hypothetical protein